MTDNETTVFTRKQYGGNNFFDLYFSNFDSDDEFEGFALIKYMNTTSSLEKLKWWLKLFYSMMT